MPGKAIVKSQKKSSKQRAISVLEQWVEVWAHDNVTKTERYPDNEELLKIASKMEPPPELIYRRLNFRSGVPPEYLWTMPNKQALLYGGGGVQRMTFQHWLQLICLEEQSGTPHIGPTGVGNLPRPNERGGCECPVCTSNQDMLEHLGYQV